MKATINKNSKIILELTESEASNLLELLETDNRRRAAEFSINRIMACWPCYSIELKIIESLRSARVTPYCSQGDY